METAVTRRQERRRRAAVWSAIAAAGLLAGAVAWLTVSIWVGLPIVVIAILVAHRGMIAPPGVAVLTYHSVADNPAWLPWADEIAVTPATLARHLDTLAAMGCSVMATRDYIAAREGGARLPPRPVLLHFDDGYLDNYVNAVPILVARGMPATFFVSLDFIEPGETCRPDPADLSGYMNWAELRAIEDSPGLEVEPHGIDHGRIAISDRTVDVLTDDNWRRHAWVQWATTPGPKHDWFRRDAPAAVPVGGPVPESGLALAVRGWANGERESAADHEARVARDLRICLDTFESRLGRTPRIFCWPENAVGAEGRRIAAELGFRATTGGDQRNTATEPASVISRIHIGDRAFGFRWLAGESLYIRAVVRLAQGNIYWYLIVAPMNLARAFVSRLDRRRRRP